MDHKIYSKAPVNVGDGYFGKEIIITGEVFTDVPFSAAEKLALDIYGKCLRETFKELDG